MKLYYPITVDLYNLYPLKKMDAQQYNVGRGALVALTAAGQVIALDKETVTLWAKKPDGKVSYLPCTLVNGQIEAEFTNQMLAVAGSVQVELQMVEGEDNITTPIFTVEVHPSNIDDDAVESQNEFTALQAAVSAINTALQEVDELKKTGLKGDPGEPGEPGAAATITVGTVAAGEPGADPQVTNVGTSNAAVFDFVLPRGETGPAGADGKEQVYFGAFADFPDEGDSEMLYVDTSNTAVLLMYRWNGTAYVPSGGGTADLNVVAKPFDPEKPYTEGEYVIEDGELYRFTSNKEAGAWDASVVDPTTVGVELSALNANTPQYNPSDDYLYINGEKWIKANLKSLKLLVNGAPTVDWSTATKNITNGLTITAQDGYLKIQGATKDVNNFAVFTVPIDVSGYSALSIEALCSSADSARIGFVTSLSPSDYTKMTQCLEFATNGYQVKTLDVSNYNIIYLAAYFYGMRSFDVKNIFVK